MKFIIDLDGTLLSGETENLDSVAFMNHLNATNTDYLVMTNSIKRKFGGNKMSRYEDGLKLMEERCGNGKDNTISLATIAMDTSPDGSPRPYVRDLDAFYEDGVFYVTTWSKSTKMQQIAKNKEVAFTVSGGWVSGNGIGENLGWVLDPKNAVIRDKLRAAFAAWYDSANDELDESCVILAIRITRATIIKDHGAERYFMDFENKVETAEGKIV